MARSVHLSFVALATLLLPISARAQDAEREAIFWKTFQAQAMALDSFITPHWREDGNRFWWSTGTAPKVAYFQYDPIAKKKSPLFDLDRLRPALAKLLGREVDPGGLPISSVTFLPGEKSARISVDGKDFTLDMDTYALASESESVKGEHARRTPQFVEKALLALSPDTYERLSPDGKWLAGTKDFNLYVRSTDNGHTEVLTKNGVKDWEWKGDSIEWSPDSKSLLANLDDERQVPLYPIVHATLPIEKLDLVRLPRTAGGSSVSATYRINVASKTIKQLQSGLKFRNWDRGVAEFIAIQTKSLQEFDLVRYNWTTNRAQRLLSERTSGVFDIGVWLENTPNYTPLASGKGFLWLSERDGWNQIYLYDNDGKLIRQLTTEHHPVIRVVDVDESAGFAYFTAYGGEGRPYDTQLYRVSLNGGPVKRLSEAPGQHEQAIYLSGIGARGEGVQFSPSHRFYVDSHSDVSRPPQTELHAADGTLVEVLAKADASATKAVRPIEPEVFNTKAADGTTDLYGIVYFPHDFDPKKSYPVVDAIYAGPQTTWVARGYAGGSSGFDQAIANQGFVVVSVDARGTPARGTEFQNVVYKNFGRYEIPDHVAVIKGLASSRPYMDLSRVGLFGGSFGGYFTIRGLVQAPDFFKVGVATAPVTELYTVSSSVALYLGSPSENPAAYEYASSLPLADKLKGKLLIIHGTADLNAPFTSTLAFIDALVKAGKRYDLVLLPDQTHAISGLSGRYYLEAVRRYLVENLKP